MNILPFGVSSEYSELEMQNSLEIELTKKCFSSEYSSIKPIIIREHRIMEIGRISDLIVYVTDKKIFNIECKLNNYIEVFEQAKDHLKWADYSYICLPCSAYVPNYNLHKLIKHGIGLIYWFPESSLFSEVVQASYNKYKDKKLRKKIMPGIKSKLSKINSKKIIQKSLF